MFRRTLMIFFVLLMAVSLIAACGGAEDPTPVPPTEAPAAAPTDTPVPEPTDTPEPEPAAEEEAEAVKRADADLVIWADDTRAPALEPVAEAFQAEYGVTVAIQEVGFGDIRDQVKLAAPAGEGPDVFIGAHDWLGELYVNGLVAPIDLGDKADQFFGPAVQAFTYDGELVGMPYATENVAFVYNPELVPEAPATWSDVIALATELEDAGTVKQGWVMQENDAYHYFPLQTAFGGYVFGVTDEGYDANDVGLDSPGSLAAASFLDQAVKDGHIVAGVDWDTMHVLYESGDAAMFVTGPWSLSRIRESGIPYAVAPLPAETEDAKPFLGVQGFMINNFSENKLLAEAFLNEFVATEDVMQAIFDVDPRPSAFLPVRDAIDDPDIAAFAAAGANGLPMPAIPEMSAVWGAWGDAITLIFQQSEDPVAAFENAGDQVRTATGAPEPTPVPEPVAEEEAEPVTRADADLVIWADDTRAPALEPVAELFQSEYGVTVAIQEVGFGDIRDTVKLAAPAGEGPDVFIGAHDWLGELYVNGLVAPIDLGDNAENFFGPAVQAFTYDGQLVGMPYATENVAFVYNPELVPEVPTTWDEVIALATELEDAGTVKQGWVMQENDAYHYFPLQTAFGGYVFGVTDEGYDPTDVGLDSEGSLAAASFLDQAVKDGHIVAGVDWDTMHVLFESGDAAMFITGPWSLPRIRESGIPYAVAAIPGQTGDSQPFLGVQGFMINNFSENKLLAEAFLNEFVATAEVMQAIYDTDPRPSAYIPVRDAIDDADVAAFAAAGANGLPMPAIPEMSAVWGAWGDAITLIFQQGEDPVAAFENAAEQVRTAIGG